MHHENNAHTNGQTDNGEREDNSPQGEIEKERERGLWSKSS